MHVEEVLAAEEFPQVALVFGGQQAEVRDAVCSPVGGEGVARMVEEILEGVEGGRGAEGREDEGTQLVHGCAWRDADTRINKEGLFICVGTRRGGWRGRTRLRRVLRGGVGGSGTGRR